MSCFIVESLVQPSVLFFQLADSLLDSLGGLAGRRGVNLIIIFVGDFCVVVCDVGCDTRQRIRSRKRSSGGRDNSSRRKNSGSNRHSYRNESRGSDGDEAEIRLKVNSVPHSGRAVNNGQAVSSSWVGFFFSADVGLTVVAVEDSVSKQSS
jgi:hypothetical protein